MRGRGWLTVVLLALTVPFAASAQPQPRIVNGLTTSDFPTTGALLSGNDPDSAFTWCSGTLIGCETFLTAAHCVCDFNGSLCQSGPRAPDPNDYLVFLQHAGFFSIASIRVEPTYNFPVGDVAVVKLAAPVDGISPTPINTTSQPPFGTAGEIAGFGRSGGSNQDYGLKRFGEVTTAACTGGISNVTSVCWNFTNPVGPPGDDSNTCNADSGGPLFLDLGAGPVVAGITSGGDSFSCLAPDASYDANVFHYRNYIQTQGGADLASTSCGALPQVGDPEVDLHEFSGTISASKREGRHSFSVPAGSAELRVSMNASEEGINDFDLYVKKGAPPTTAHFDCRAFGSNQYGYCDFDSPNTGTWHVLVNRHSGAGTYQATATVFNPDLAPTDCNDGIDNDLDGLADASDPGCADAADLDERSPLLVCDNGDDDDNDGRNDFDPLTAADPGDANNDPAGQGDPGCRGPSSNTESPACQDGDDDDGDGGVDYDAGRSANGSPDPGGPDIQCPVPWKNRETPRRCGLGFELVLLLPLLARMRTARRRARPC